MPKGPCQDPFWDKAKFRNFGYLVPTLQPRANSNNSMGLRVDLVGRTTPDGRNFYHIGEF